MLNVKNTIIDTLLSVVAPHLCSGCGEIGTTFCDNCKYDIIRVPFLHCILCDRAAEIGVCDDHKTVFNQAWVVGSRGSALQRLIDEFKFKNMKASAAELADLLDKRLPPLPNGTVFVPIPTAPSHIRERGYDHTLLITKELARKRLLPVKQVLLRHNELTQHRVGRKERFIQAETAFTVKSALDPELMYVIVDDVVTTGATITQAAKLLRQARAVNICAAITSWQPLD